MATSDNAIVQAIVAHAWSPDGSQLAIAPNSAEVYIYATPSKNPDTWEKKFVLTEHEGFVSALDWNAKGQLVTCGHDRNAYVWEYDAKENDWNPTLVILRINRAATHVRWSPSGLKFAVASGSKVVPVCTYEKSNNWWVSKMIKAHKSTVTSVAWSPDSKLVATGSTDFKARICSAFMEEIDSAEDPYGYADMFPQLNQFGEHLMEYGNSKGWVNNAIFNPNGLGLVYAGQGATLHFVDLKGKSTQDVNHKELAYLDMGFLNANTLVCVGFDCIPVVYTHSSDKWVLSKALDSNVNKADSKAAGTAAAAARNRFQAADTRGAQFGSDVAEDTFTRHKNVITGVRIRSATEFTTSGVDGRVLWWKL